MERCWPNYLFIFCRLACFARIILQMDGGHKNIAHARTVFTLYIVSHLPFLFLGVVCRHLNLRLCTVSIMRGRHCHCCYSLGKYSHDCIEGDLIPSLCMGQVSSLGPSGEQICGTDEQQDELGVFVFYVVCLTPCQLWPSRFCTSIPQGGKGISWCHYP